jgi:toxin CptA
MFPATALSRERLMDIVLVSTAYVVAAICAGLMGYAIQRGATCTVAAMDELVRRRSFNRLGSMVEASLWVVGGLLIVQALRLPLMMPAGYAVTHLTVVGAGLLGFGAYVNGACVFGAVARLGSGEWAYVATPLGFYAGCVTFPHVLPSVTQQRLPYDSAVLHASPWVALPFGAFMLWRIARPLFQACAAPAAAGGPPLRRLGEWISVRVWSPRAATTMIGVTFFLMLLLVGAWAYTDVLAELARGTAGNLVARCLLVLALFAGAMLGGYTAGRWRSTPITPAGLSKCFVGGLLMGWGSLLIPGGNDGLVLVGMPLLWPYAWVAFLTMCITIGAALVVERNLRGHASEQAVH